MWKVEHFYHGLRFVAITPAFSLSLSFFPHFEISYQTLFTSEFIRTHKHSGAKAKNSRHKLKMPVHLKIAWLLNKHLKMCPINHLQTFCGISFADTIMQIYEIYCSLLCSPPLSIVKFMNHDHNSISMHFSFTALDVCHCITWEAQTGNKEKKERDEKGTWESILRCAF